MLNCVNLSKLESGLTVRQTFTLRQNQIWKIFCLKIHSFTRKLIHNLIVGADWILNFFVFITFLFAEGIRINNDLFYFKNTYRKKFWMTKPLLPGTTPPLQLSTPSARIECACAADLQPQPKLFTFLIFDVFSYLKDFSEVAH